MMILCILRIFVQIVPKKLEKHDLEGKEEDFKKIIKDLPNGKLQPLDI